eukprot:287372_1
MGLWLWVTQILLYYLVVGCQLENGSMIYSSGGRYSTNLTECIYPSSEQEIIDLINMVQQTNSSIRATGKSHSRSGVNMMEENVEINKQLFMINMSVNMNNIIELNLDENFMTFEAGLSLFQVFEYLESYNLTLPNWGGGPLIANFVGNIITGSHGMGTLKNPVGTVATNVIGLKMITSNGTIIEANNTFNKHIFDAVRISFGALGIITQITVRTVPIFYGTKYSETRIENVNDIQVIKQYIEKNITHFVTFYDNFFNQYSFFGNFIRNAFKIIKNDTNKTERKCWNQNEEMESESMNNDNNVYVDVMECTDIYYKTFHSLPSVASWDKTAPISQPIEYEMFVGAQLWKDALIGVFEWIFTQKNDKTDLWIETEIFYNKTENDGDITMEWRFVGMDNIWLSPSYNSDIFQIGMHFRGEYSLYIIDKWTFGIHKYLQNNFGPVRYHWGKQSLSNYCDLQESYPKLEDFKHLRYELDPNGIFINKFIRDKL